MRSNIKDHSERRHKAWSEGTEVPEFVAWERQAGYLNGAKFFKRGGAGRIGGGLRER